MLELAVTKLWDWGPVQDKKSDLQNVVTGLLASPHHSRMLQTLSDASVP
jgi:hypothetical protein